MFWPLKLNKWSHFLSFRNFCFISLTVFLIRSVRNSGRKKKECPEVGVIRSCFAQKQVSSAWQNFSCLVVCIRTPSFLITILLNAQNHFQSGHQNFTGIKILHHNKESINHSQRQHLKVFLFYLFIFVLSLGPCHDLAYYYYCETCE